MIDASDEEGAGCEAAGFEGCACCPCCGCMLHPHEDET